MRFPSILLAAAVSGLVGAHVYAADAPDDARRSMGNLRPDSRTAGQAIQGSPPAGSTSGGTAVVPGYSPGYPYSGYSPYYRGYGYYPRDYGYYPYYPPAYRYPRFYRGYLYPPPVYLPAERLYGPQALRRFMGAAP